MVGVVHQHVNSVARKEKQEVHLIEEVEQISRITDQLVLDDVVVGYEDVRLMIQLMWWVVQMIYALLLQEGAITGTALDKYFEENRVDLFHLDQGTGDALT